MALRRVFRAFVCAYRGMDGKFHRAKKPFVVFWSYFTGVLVGRDDVHGVVLGRDGTRSVRRVRRARKRRGKSDIWIVCVGQVFALFLALFFAARNPLLGLVTMTVTLALMWIFCIFILRSRAGKLAKAAVPVLLLWYSYLWSLSYAVAIIN